MIMKRLIPKLLEIARAQRLALGIALMGLSAVTASAHCDAESGPVAGAAREALATGSYQGVGIWVGPKQDAELREAFSQALPVYKLGGDARQLSERFFMETAVRLHRDAEGFPYSGLKPAQELPADIAAAERALQTGDLQPVSGILAEALGAKLNALFKEALEARKSKDESLEAGRRWADAYVRYVVYVHGVLETLQQGPGHGVE
jgi:hypothetical protein